MKLCSSTRLMFVGTVALCVLLVAGFGGVAQAQMELSDSPLCWRLDPFPLDILQLNVVQLRSIGSRLRFSLSGTWRFATPDGYQLMCSGFGTQSPTNQAFHIGLVCSNDTTSFLGEAICRLDGYLAFTSPFNGISWSYECSNGFPSSNTATTMTRVTCVEEPTSSVVGSLTSSIGSLTNRIPSSMEEARSLGIPIAGE